MKDTAKPLKGIRIQILTLLARKQDLTVADMIDSLPDFSEKQIGDNCYQAKQDGLLSSRMDGITRKQAYSITEQGKSRIKSEAVEPIKQSTKNVDEPIKRNPFQPQGADMAELRKLVEDGAKENARLRSLNTELDKQTDELLRVNSVLRESQSAGVTRIDELAAALVDAQTECRTRRDDTGRLSDEKLRVSRELADAYNEVLHLKSRCDELMKTNAEIARSALSSGDQHQVTVEQFLIRVPKRKPEVVKSFEKARQRAMSAAKSVGKVEVYGLVQVGRAVRGAVWEQS